MTEKECVCGNHSIDVDMDVSESMIYDIADFFKMFADSTRVKIMMALGSREIAVCEIATTLNMSVSAVSHQLRSLRTAKLVKSRRDGKNIYYSLDDDHVDGILKMAIEHMEE